jgi:hypothetical protein
VNRLKKLLGFRLARAGVVPLLGVFCLSGLAAMTGCGEGADFAPVEGKVTLAGKPLADAYLTFQPKRGTPDQVSIGKTDSEGHFVLTQFGTDRPGALVGMHQVSLTTIAPDAMKDERTKLPKDRIPKRYERNPLQFEVSAAGTTAADFDLVP